jgi:hypothetical protein
MSQTLWSGAGHTGCDPFYPPVEIANGVDVQRLKTVRVPPARPRLRLPLAIAGRPVDPDPASELHPVEVRGKSWGNPHPTLITLRARPRQQGLPPRDGRARAGRERVGRIIQELRPQRASNSKTEYHENINRGAALRCFVSDSDEFVQSALGRGGVGRTVAFSTVVARAWQISRAMGGSTPGAAGDSIRGYTCPHVDRPDLER